MKIWLIAVSSILVITSVLSGFYIYTLNTHINDLEAEMETQFAGADNRMADLDSQIIDTKSTLTGMLETSESEYTMALLDQETALADYQTTMDSAISGIQGDITSAYSQIGSITTDVSGIRDNVLFTEALYDKVKDSVVTIMGEDKDGSGLIYDHRLLGSGFLYNGRVITAYHVVEDPSNIRVIFVDGSVLTGYVEMYSKELDVAVLFLTAVSTDTDNGFRRAFPTLSGIDIADSDTVTSGDPVFVIGSPGDDEDYRMGLQGTLTSGVVSQVNRCTTVENDFRTNLIQFDAPVNFGNSGSPLFNKDGEVIGLVIARLNPLLGDGIGMAVTSNQVLKVQDAIPPTDPDALRPFGLKPLFEYEYYPWSGLIVNDFNTSTREVIAKTGAVVIKSIGPAVGAGIQKGDVITAIDDIPVHNSDDFYCFLADNYKVGDKIAMTYLRGEDEVTKTITLEKKP